MNIHLPTLLRGRSLVVTVAALAAAASVSAQENPPSGDAHVVLEKYIVSASRTPQSQQDVSSSVTALSLSDLADLQVADLRTALSAEPGVAIVNTGPVGGQSSVFIRGASSHQTLFVVDGVRMNDRSAAYNNFLGAADLGGLDRIEILRGPQSTLYGSSAMGGVILLDTAHGCAPFSGAVAASAGSFDTLGASIAAQGGTKVFGYSAAASVLDTANKSPANDFRAWSYSTRLEATPLAALLIGATFRGQNGDYEDRGSLAWPSHATVANDNYLTTVYAEARAAETFRSRLTLAEHDRHYVYNDLDWGSVSDLKNRRDILEWQNTWRATDQVELVGGANVEHSRYTVDGARTTEEIAAGYLSGTVKPVKNVTLTAGLRYDDFKSIGSATTWRTGAAWLPIAGTKLRATYGTGFSAPGSDDRYGVAEWGQLPNPNLRPEKSRGWDVGIDQSIAGDRVSLSATYFRNKFTNLFEWQYVDYVTYQGMTVNRAKATTSGIELAASAKLTSTVKSRLAYTYLDATDDADHVRLVRRPRHTLDAEVSAQVLKPWLAGVGVHIVADRVDGSGKLEDYTTVRLFTSYALRPDLTLKARVENVLDERYEETAGYPALPLGAYGSVEWRF
jgi:vitamin B12 transporter